MRKKFLSLGVAVAALGLLPAAAEAHHVDHAASSVACVLVGGAPTVQATVAYRQFADSDKPVQVAVYIDGQLVDHTWLTWPGQDYDHAWSRAVAPGGHDVHYWAGWARNSTSDSVDAHVNCPAPPPPPPAPPVAPPAPPTTIVVCNGVTMPPGTLATACAPPPKKVTPPCACKPRPHCVPKHARLKVFPLRRLHGEVIFTLNGVRRVDVVSVHWAVHRPGHRWRHVGRSGRPWERLAHGGLSWHVYLWVESVWGYPQWGRHQVRATAKIRTTCGVRTITRRLAYMNHDPEPRAHAWS